MQLEFAGTAEPQVVLAIAKSEVLTPVIAAEVMLTAAAVPFVTVSVWDDWVAETTADANASEDGATVKGELDSRRTAKSGGTMVSVGWNGEDAGIKLKRAAVLVVGI